MSKARLFGHSFLWVFTVSIVLLAVILLLARFYLTEAPAYKKDLEAFLSQEIGGQIKIGDMSASMQGFEPQISLKNISLGDLKTQKKALGIEEMRLSFDPIGFLSGRINPTKITIVNTSISVKRFSDGHLSIAGFSNKQPKESSSSDFSWLMEDGRFEVIDSQIIWQDAMRDLPDVTLNNAHIVFQNNGQEHVLKMRASLPQDSGDSLVFSIKAVGDVLSGNDWRAEGYLNAKRINVKKYLSRLKVKELPITEGEGDIELWSTWESAALTQTKGRVLVRQAELRQDEKLLNITNLTGHFDWKKTDNGWHVEARNVAFESNNIKQEPSEFGVSYFSTEDEAYTVQASVDGVDLQAVSTVLQKSGLLDQQMSSLAETIRIRGWVNDAHFTLNSHAEAFAWGVCGELERVSTDAYESFPVTNDVTATLCATQDEGWLNLNTANGSVHFDPLFRDPIVIDELAGLLAWSHNDEGWVIHSEHLELNSPHITSQTRLDMQLFDDKRRPVIDLQTNFGRAEGRFTSLYLPVGIMGDGLVHWLDNAFIEGDIKSCGLILKGPLTDFPFRQKTGAFQVLFGTEDVLLHYAEGWPNVLGASADVEFKNEGMEIVGYKGTISGNDIEHVLVDIKDLKTDQYLNLTGKIEDDINGLYTFFKQSPIEKRMSSLLARSRVLGPAVIDLDIKIPLKKALNTKVEARATLKGNRLLFPDIDLAIDQIQGVIHYDDSGLSGKSIKGVTLGQHLTVDIKPEKNSTLVLGEGTLDIASIAKQYPADIWTKIKGSSAANLVVELPHSGLTGGGEATVTLNSNLKGISVDLPKPVGKKVGKALPFKVVVGLGANGLPVNASYGHSLRSVFNFKENASKKLALETGDIHLGVTPATLPIKKGVRLSGKVAVLDVSQWKDALGLGKAGGANSSLVNQLNLKVGELHWLDTTFDDVHLIGEHKNAAWVGEVRSPLVLGRYALPDNLNRSNKITLDLETLTLPSYEKLDVEGSRSPLSPEDIPNIDVRSKSLIVGESSLGELNLQLRQKDNGMVIQALSLRSDRDEFTANGAWEITLGQSRTGLTGRLNSQSLGGLLKDAKVTSKLKDAPVDVYFDMHWPGEPQEFSKDHLNGYADIKSARGRLLDIEPGIGRVFGLLSLTTLQRRLQLDFSDLVQKGLSFDKIKGRFVLVDGTAHAKRFYLESPSARLDFQGTVGLATETVDQLITVTPKTTESLPLAGAIAGGPLLGAAVYIVQKIAGKTVNKLVGYQYHVTGPWEDPKIEQLSKPGGKIFGMMDNVLTPVFDATIGLLPIDSALSELPFYTADEKE